MLVTWEESDGWFTESNKHFTCKKSPTTRKENLERILTSLAWNQAPQQQKEKNGERSEPSGGLFSPQIAVQPASNAVFFALIDFSRLFLPMQSLPPGYNKLINQLIILGLAKQKK